MVYAKKCLALSDGWVIFDPMWDENKYLNIMVQWREQFSKMWELKAKELGENGLTIKGAREVAKPPTEQVQQGGGPPAEPVGILKKPHTGAKAEGAEVEVAAAAAVPPKEDPTEVKKPEPTEVPHEERTDVPKAEHTEVAVKGPGTNKKKKGGHEHNPEGGAKKK